MRFARWESGRGGRGERGAPAGAGSPGVLRGHSTAASLPTEPVRAGPPLALPTVSGTALGEGKRLCQKSQTRARRPARCSLAPPAAGPRRTAAWCAWVRTQQSARSKHASTEQTCLLQHTPLTPQVSLQCLVHKACREAHAICQGNTQAHQQIGTAACGAPCARTHAHHPGLSVFVACTWGGG